MSQLHGDCELGPRTDLEARRSGSTSSGALVCASGKMGRQHLPPMTSVSHVPPGNTSGHVLSAVALLRVTPVLIRKEQREVVAWVRIPRSHSPHIRAVPTSPGHPWSKDSETGCWNAGPAPACTSHMTWGAVGVAHGCPPHCSPEQGDVCFTSRGDWCRL